MNGEPTLHARTAADWRAWLDEHAALQRAISLIIYHKRGPTPSVLVPEAVEQALCFGWIDGHARKRDAESFYLRFTPRHPRGSRFRVGRPRGRACRPVDTSGWIGSSSGCCADAGPPAWNWSAPAGCARLIRRDERYLPDVT